MKRRRGFALIELVMLVAVASVLLGLCAGTLHSLMKVDRSSRAHLAGLMREAHLAKVFRADVRAALGTAESPPNTLTLDLGEERRVEYRLQGTELVRAERVGGSIRNQDAFPLPRGGSARFDVEPRGSITTVRLVIARIPAKADSPSGRATQLESIIGQDHRFDKVEK